MSFLIVQFLNGLASASSLFLVAAGLSIIFGVSRIVNFAHGSFYMLGAYTAWSLVTRLPYGSLGFWGGIVVAALVIGAVGALVEVVLLRRIYAAPELFQLLATFGVVLLVQDATLAIWGPEDLLGPRAPGLRGALVILDQRFPQYELLLIFIGPAVLGILWLLFHRTRWGTLVRAATLDREMVAALGVDQKLLFTSVFFVGSCLAALGGGLQLPRQPIALNMDLTTIADAFVVVVVGGLGSITGAYLAALVIAELQAFLLLTPAFTVAGVTVTLSEMTLVPSFVVMAVVLILRPYGLLGRPPALARAAGGIEPVVRPAARELKWLGAVVLILLVLAPAVAGPYALSILTEIAILVLMATSLHFIMGPGGMASFGHAAYFGLGAYGAALAAKYLGAGMADGLVAAPLFAAVGGVIFGWFCVRLSGVYLAMLTLAFAQIVWSIAFQWVKVTGGDNGLLGIWPAPWAAGKTAYYYLALAACIAGTLLLRRIIYAPFGYALRAARDSPLRTEAIGINVRHVQWAGFVIAAAVAGLAGGLFVYFKGSVFPTYIAISKSIDALMMVLLGGVQTIAGPLVGAAGYTLLQDQLVTLTDYWRGVLGVVIIGLVLAFPQGIAGFTAQRWTRLRGEKA
ncbi:MAG: ABC transporter permease [Alphaproteobacteria bacterium]|nr:ABC transporter permease [Alphaproteobacteria bacterium]